MTCRYLEKKIKATVTKPCILELYSWAMHALRNTRAAPTSRLHHITNNTLG